MGSLLYCRVWMFSPPLYFFFFYYFIILFVCLFIYLCIWGSGRTRLRGVLLGRGSARVWRWLLFYGVLFGRCRSVNRWLCDHAAILFMMLWWYFVNRVRKAAWVLSSGAKLPPSKWAEGAPRYFSAMRRSRTKSQPWLLTINQPWKYGVLFPSLSEW